LKAASTNRLKEYLSFLIEGGRNSMDRLLAIARYCYFAKKNAYYVYFTSILNGREILPLIGKKLALVAGEETSRRVFHRFDLPPLGSPPDDYPKLTKMILDRLENELPAATCREILTGNYHEIPSEAFKDKKERFGKAKNIDAYLKEENRRFVKEIAAFMKKGRIWYEQEITPEVVEFVKKNPEFSGVRRGDKVYVTKIPYAPSDYLKEKDPTLKRYFACHCPLVRTAIRDGMPRIPSIFCYCSGGFTKLAFDIIFGQPTEVELLESVLKGDSRCRFAITIPKGKMK
jgi:predicted hydrocarbon binding protein